MTDPQKLKGRRFDAIFGNVPVDILVPCLKCPKEPIFGGTLFEYVLEQEGVEIYER